MSYGRRTQFLLGIEGDSALNLSDPARHVVLDEALANWPMPSPGEAERVLTLPLLIQGATPNEFYRNRMAIERLLREAVEAAADHGRKGVVLSVRHGSDDWTYYDVLRGRLLPQGPVRTAQQQFWVLELTCLPYGRGAPYTWRPESGPVRNLSGSVLEVPAPGGDAPALGRLTVTDRSDGAVINRLRVATFARHALSPGAYNPVIPFSAEGFGVTVDEPDSVTGEVARLTTSGDWQTVGIARKPAGCITRGHFDLWVRARDAAIALRRPVGLSAAQTDGVDRVQTVARTYRVGSGGGSVSIAWNKKTEAGNTLLLITTGAALTPPAEWTQAAAGGTTNNTRIYYMANAEPQSGSITFTVSGNARGALFLIEYRGITPSNPLDQTTSNSGTSGTPDTGTTSTTTQAYEVAIAAFSSWGEQEKLPFPGTPSNGFTRISRQFERVFVSDPEGPHFAYIELYDVLEKRLTETGDVTTSQPMLDSGAWSAALATFKATASAKPELPLGLYQYRIVAVHGPSGALSAASDIVQAVAQGDFGSTAILVSWAPVAGATGYRVYWRRTQPSPVAWNYAEVSGGETTSWLHASDTPGTEAVPPDLPTAVLSELRIGVGTASGRVLRYGRPFSARMGNGMWELLSATNAHLPPIPDGDDWQVVLEARHPHALAVEVDADVLVLMPHPSPACPRPQAHALWQATDGTPARLDEQRAWHLEQGKTGALTARLSDPDTGEDAGMLLQAQGGVEIGPGDTVLLIAADVEDGVSAVEDCEYDVELEITPRTSYLFGGL